MRDLIAKARTTLSSAPSRLLEILPAAGDLKSRVAIDIYLVHQSRGAEDYEILCDFERFATENQTGLFSRPYLRVWAGRQDFERHIFARRLREAFAEQFEAVRAARAEAERASRRGFFALPSLWEIGTTVAGLGASMVSTIVLYLAVKAGGGALEDIRGWLRDSTVGRAFRGKSAGAQLEAEIDKKKAVIDQGLRDIEIMLHRDLYLHAWREGPAGPMTGMNREAWPLPDFVRDRMS